MGIVRHAYHGIALVSVLYSSAAAPVFAPLSVDLNSKGEEQGLLVGGGIEDANHELYGGLYSQMVFGESFEEPTSKDGVSGGDAWTPSEFIMKGRSGPSFKTWKRGSQGKYNVSQDAFNGKQSQSVADGSVLNFGPGQQGMHFEAGRDYTGHLYVKVQAAARISVRLITIRTNSSMEELATASFNLGLDATTSEWSRLDFRLLTSGGTTCGVTAVPRGSSCVASPELNANCYECSGGVAIQVVGGPVLLDMVFLQPGEWGRYQGLPVRRDVAEAMFSLASWQVVRLGGSMCTSWYYRWKRFRGPASLRNDYRGAFYPYVSSGFRIFETLELCEAAGATCAITLNNVEDPEDMADFVEYCFGNTSTTWGWQRAIDGRENPYKPFTIEIGNEQGLTHAFVAQVRTLTTAMNARAQKLQLGFTLRFAVGQNIDMNNFKSTGLNVTLDMLDSLKSLGATVSWDAHIGGDNFADSESFMQVMEAARDVFRSHQSKMRLLVFEENGNTHNLQRALVHARFNIVSSYAGGFFLLDTAASGLQVLGQNENGWDQGQVFMTPDKAWLSPHGWSQWMLARHAEFSVPINITKGPQGLDVGAYVSKTGELGFRTVNWGTTPVNCSIHVPLDLTVVPEVEAYELASASGNLADVNPPFDPLRVSPQRASRGSVRLVSGGFIVDWQFQPNSFVTIALRLARSYISSKVDLAIRPTFVI